MKLKCKQCFCKFKVASIDDIICDKPNCELKYKMTGGALDFSNIKPTACETVQVFESPDEVDQLHMEEKDWKKYLDENGFTGGY